jgi:hypothetical protein
VVVDPVPVVVLVVVVVVVLVVAAPLSNSKAPRSGAVPSHGIPTFAPLAHEQGLPEKVMLVAVIAVMVRTPVTPHAPPVPPHPSIMMS